MKEMMKEMCSLDCGEFGSCEMYNSSMDKCMCDEGHYGKFCQFNSSDLSTSKDLVTQNMTLTTDWTSTVTANITVATKGTITVTSNMTLATDGTSTVTEGESGEEGETYITTKPTGSSIEELTTQTTETPQTTQTTNIFTEYESTRGLTYQRSLVDYNVTLTVVDLEADPNDDDTVLSELSRILYDTDQMDGLFQRLNIDEIGFDASSLVQNRNNLRLWNINLKLRLKYETDPTRPTDDDLMKKTLTRRIMQRLANFTKDGDYRLIIGQDLKFQRPPATPIVASVPITNSTNGWDLGTMNATTLNATTMDPRTTDGTTLMNIEGTDAVTKSMTTTYVSVANVTDLINNGTISMDENDVAVLNDTITEQVTLLSNTIKNESVSESSGLAALNEFNESTNSFIVESSGFLDPDFTTTVSVSNEVLIVDTTTESSISMSSDLTTSASYPLVSNVTADNEDTLSEYDYLEIPDVTTISDNAVAIDYENVIDSSNTTSDGINITLGNSFGSGNSVDSGDIVNTEDTVTLGRFDNLDVFNSGIFGDSGIFGKSSKDNVSSAPDRTADLPPKKLGNITSKEPQSIPTTVIKSTTPSSAIEASGENEESGESGDGSTVPVADVSDDEDIINSTYLYVTDMCVNGTCSLHPIHPDVKIR